MGYRLDKVRRLFSLRTLRFFWQRRTRGWDDSVTWNLDQEVASFLAPRLRRFIELNNGFPNGSTEEEWDEELEEMCWGAEWYAENAYEHPSIEEAEKFDEDMRRAQKGLLLVMERLRGLWW